MNSLPKMVLAALFTGLMVAGALITIPFPGVPLVIANAFPWLAGLLLGPLWASVSTGLYLLLGAFGLPVFAKGAAGIGTLLGNTGGFLFGYLLSTLVVGWLRDPEAKSVLRASLAVVAGLVTVYLAGIPWLAFVAFKGPAGFELDHLQQAFFWATGPATFPLLFVLGDAVKAVAVVAVAGVLARLPGVAPLLKK
jgi:biotin transport system substrate-specific component